VEPAWQRWGRVGLLALSVATSVGPGIGAAIRGAWSPTSVSTTLTRGPSPTGLEPAVADEDPSRWVVLVGLGDSLTAGMQDGTLESEHQDHGYLAQFARQSAIELNLPRIEGGSIPPRVLGPVFKIARYHEMRGQLREAVKGVAVRTAYAWPGDRNNEVFKVEGHGHRAPGPQDSFAVPGYEYRHLTDIHGVRDFLQEIHDTTDEVDALVNEVPLTREVLQNGTDRAQGSQVEQALKRKPDIVVLWAGANDALAPAFAGVVDDRTLTPIMDKTWEYWHQDLATNQWVKVHTRHVMPGMYSAILGKNSAIEQLKRGTTAEIFIFTVPHVESIPFLKTVGKAVGDLPFRVELENGEDVTDLVEGMVLPDRIKGPSKKDRKTFPQGSRVGLGNILDLVATLGKGTGRAGFEAKLRALQGVGAFTEFDVLDPEELEVVRDRVNDYNDLLRRAAKDPRVHLVDVNPLFDQARREGLPLRTATGAEIRVTTGFSGVKDERGFDGIFSLDGVHPSDTGHAVLANALLDAVQRDLGDRARFHRFMAVPPVDEGAVHRQETHGGRDNSGG